MVARVAWLDWRRGGIGGSDVGAICGVSRWAGPWDVWLSKTLPLDEQSANDDNSRLTGRLLEEAVGKWAAAELGLELAPAAPTTGLAQWMRATPDYWLVGDDIEQGLECKTAEYPRDGWGTTGTDEVPASYALQCRWYMAVTGRQWWYLACFFKRCDQWRMYRIERDEEQEAAMVARMGAWWRRHVLDGEPPELDASPAATRGLAVVHPAPTDRGNMRIATATEERLALDYRATKEAIKSLDTEARSLGNQLRAAIGDAAGVRWSLGRARWSRPSNRLTVTVRQH